MDESTIKGLFSLLALPPAAPLLLAVLGAALAMRARAGRAGRWLLWFGLAGAWALSTPALNETMIGWVEDGAPDILTAERLAAEQRGARPPGAIVVLGGGTRHNRSEWPDAERVNARTLERLAFAARLARSSNLPVLVSGGTPPRREHPEARLMARSLQASFGLTPRWIEARARDTSGNASESARMLRAAGVKRIVLVTHAYHMPRALAAFRATGLDVIAAPHGFAGASGGWGWRDFVPSAGAVMTGWLATHEIAGRLWYRVRGLI